MSTAKEYQWKRGVVNTDYYHDSDGKIVGKVSRGSFSDDTYYAEVNGNVLGEYIDQKAAKRAVEIAIADKTLFNLRPVTEDFYPRDGYNGIGEEVAKWAENNSWPQFVVNTTYKDE